MQNDDSQNDRPGQEPESDPQPSQTGGRAKRHIKKLNIFAGKGKYEAVVLLVVIVIIAGVAYYFGRSTKQNYQAQPASSAKSTVSTENGSIASNLPAATFLSGNTYLNSPQKLGDLGFITNYQVFGCESDCAVNLKIAYYQIGTTSDGRKIDVMTYVNGPGGNAYVFALAQNGTYDALAQNSDDPANFATYWKPSLSGKVNIDDKTKLDDIKMPLEATIANQKMKVLYAPDGDTEIHMVSMSLMENGLTSIRGGFYGDVASSAIKKLGSQDDTDFYEVTVDDTPNYKVMEYHGAYKQLFTTDYNPNGEIAGASGDLSINWSSGSNNKSSYISSGQGCGSTGYVIAKNISDSNLTKVGTTPKGQTVYQLPQSNPLVQEIFSKDYAGGEFVDDSSLKNLPIDQFSKQHGYFIAKNGLGEYVLFLRSDMIVHGGCAKPVIYLYPQQKQQVSVKVGAQVVNSDPVYGNGWDNVTAYPDGSLSYKGKTYGSLFWDGYGYGAYPDINSGTIVRTSDVPDTVKSQLRQQGLNAQEITDFMNFWGPKLASVSQPYTRLTWFNTAQMNRLAPLQISPAPRTLIRVFLDFQGLDKPYDLTPQNLNPLNRKGFTVVEWGGLARNGLGG